MKRRQTESLFAQEEIQNFRTKVWLNYLMLRTNTPSLYACHNALGLEEKTYKQLTRIASRPDKLTLSWAEDVDFDASYNLPDLGAAAEFEFGPFDSRLWRALTITDRVELESEVFSVLNSEIEPGIQVDKTSISELIWLTSKLPVLVDIPTKTEASFLAEKAISVDNANFEVEINLICRDAPRMSHYLDSSDFMRLYDPSLQFERSSMPNSYVRNLFRRLASWIALYRLAQMRVAWHQYQAILERLLPILQAPNRNDPYRIFAWLEQYHHRFDFKIQAVRTKDDEMLETGVEF
jgi:hypothetical protein